MTKIDFRKASLKKNLQSQLKGEKKEREFNLKDTSANCFVTEERQNKEKD